MRFTTSVSVGACRQRLSSHESMQPILADTQIELDITAGNCTQFKVSRVWKGTQNWLRYPVMQVTGTLKPESMTRTEVIAHLEVREMGLLLIGLALFFLAMAFTYPQNVTGWLMVIILIGLCAYDWYVLHHILRDLQV